MKLNTHLGDMVRKDMELELDKASKSEEKELDADKEVVRAIYHLSDVPSEVGNMLDGIYGDIYDLVNENMEGVSTGEERDSKERMCVNTQTPSFFRDSCREGMA